MRAAQARPARRSPPAPRRQSSPGAEPTTRLSGHADSKRVLPIGLAAAFLLGYVAGIPSGRTFASDFGTALAGYYMDGTNFRSFVPVFTGMFSGAFLQATWVMLCGFHLWGGALLVLFFALKGGLMGVCAACVYLQGGTRSLVVHWLLTCLPDLAVFLVMLWLSVTAGTLSRRLYHVAVNGGRGSLMGEIRQLLLRYLIAVALCAAGCALFAASAVLLAGVLL